MSIEWYLVKESTREVFELGKGEWHLTSDAWTTRATLLEALAQTLASFKFDSGRELFDYLFWLRDKLWAFGGVACKVVHDEQWYDLEAQGYKLVGSRYTSEDTDYYTNTYVRRKP